MNLMNERQIEKIINLMQTDDAADAPADARRWAKNIFVSRAAAPQKSFVRRILAVLQMDLSPNKAAFGERSASVSKARQMFFRAGENALDLRVSTSKKGFNLHGQILGEGFANAFVKIGELGTNADEMSEFKFENVPGGRYTLTFQSGEKEIVVEDLEIRQANFTGV